MPSALADDVLYQLLVAGKATANDQAHAAKWIVRLQDNLNGRDDFLGKIGQWDAFVAQLPK